MNPAASVPWVAGDVGAGGIPVFVLVRCALCVQPESHVFYRTKNRNVPPLVIVRDFHIDRFFIQFSGIGGFGRLAVTAI
jgi:hypothetical protein